MEKIQKFVDQVNRYMASRQRLDVQDLYARLAPRYPGVLRIADGDRAHGEDFQILQGVSAAGWFEVYDNGLDIVFDVVRPDGSYTHWHPSDAESVIGYIAEFMNGQSEDGLFPFKQTD